jgi:hypothetical protein
MKATPTLARIMALQEEQRVLWDRTKRLGEAERGKLLDIAQELETLWNKRRMELAGLDTDQSSDPIEHPFEPDARRTRWTKRRGRAKQDPEDAPREREVGM